MCFLPIATFCLLDTSTNRIRSVTANLLCIYISMEEVKGVSVECQVTYVLNC